MTVVIAGRPNAGKSSLLNALAGHDAAIVTDIPGTTRDVLRERINLDGMPLHIADTAGLRDAGGRRRSGRHPSRASGNAARRSYSLPDRRHTRGRRGNIAQEIAALPADIPVTYVINKIDLTGREPALNRPNPPRVFVSVASGAGIELLREHLKHCAGFQNAESGTWSARRRHLDALDAHSRSSATRREFNSSNIAPAK